MKKGQANPQQYVALLIFVIGVSIIVYIIMLPPAERALLLEQNRTSAEDLDNIKDRISILMEKEPGTLRNVADEEITHDLPAFNLYTRTDASALIEFDSLYIKKSLFEEQQRNISFKIDSFENTDNFVLSFTAQKRSGILTIVLNGNIIHSNVLATQSPPPLKLSKDLLQEQNTLLFKVSGPGIEFWKSNEYTLQDMKITAEITDTSAQDNKQLFLVTEQEKENIESFELSFAVDCKSTDVGPLLIFLDKRQIFSGIPECGSVTKVPEVSGDRLRQGENDLLFRTEKGNYLIYRTEIKLTFKEPIFPTYYFTIDEKTFDKIEQDKTDINVTMLFPSQDERKKGIVRVNGANLEINSFDKSFNRNVDSLVREGNNAIEIIPQTDKLDILEIKVLLAE